MERFNGVLDSIEPIRDYEYGVYTGSNEIKDTFPKTFQLKPLTIKDQGAWAACVGCAMATVLESHYGEEFSEGWNYGKLRDQNETCSGMIHSKAIEYLKEIGGIPKSKFDILTEMPEMKGICKKFPEFDVLAQQYKISGYVKLDAGDSRTGKLKDLQIKDALTKHKKPLFAISPKAFGGSHAICIIGWDDDTNEYILQNSWGNSYGENGVGRVDKSEIRQVYVFLFEDITLPFTDVNKEDWFYNSVKQCYMAGLIKGKTENTFEPNLNITRAEACAMLDRLMQKIDEQNATLNKLIGFKHEFNQLKGEL